MMLRIVCLVMSISITMAVQSAEAQDIREYVVKRTTSALVIDGLLSEPEWEAAEFTETFIKYTDGSVQKYPTQAKMLWDDSYLYIAFISEDIDVWSTFIYHDSYLWQEEVVEMFIDPDGDGINYMELQVNPKGTRMDLLMSKSYSDGGSADFDWNLEGFSSAITVDGTLNEQNDTDTMWICEVALPFEHLAFSAPSMIFPPADGTSWRINLYRYEYIRDNKSPKELSAWNQTDSRGFHAPDKFGRIIYSSEPVLSKTSVADTEALPGAFTITGNYPNPFNMATTIGYSVKTAGTVKLNVYTILGQNIRTLVDSFHNPGVYNVVWDGRNTSAEPVTSGLYIVRMQLDSQAKSHRMLFLK